MCLGLITWDGESMGSHHWRRWTLLLSLSRHLLSVVSQLVVPGEISSTHTGMSAGTVILQIFFRLPYCSDLMEFTKQRWICWLFPILFVHSFIPFCLSSIHPIISRIDGLEWDGVSDLTVSWRHGSGVHVFVLSLSRFSESSLVCYQFLGVSWGIPRTQLHRRTDLLYLFLWQHFCVSAVGQGQWLLQSLGIRLHPAPTNSHSGDHRSTLFQKLGVKLQPRYFYF